jgi:hypothetical protein
MSEILEVSERLETSEILEKRIANRVRTSSRAVIPLARPASLTTKAPFSYKDLAIRLYRPILPTISLLKTSSLEVVGYVGIVGSAVGVVGSAIGVVGSAVGVVGSAVGVVSLLTSIERSKESGRRALLLLGA